MKRNKNNSLFDPVLLRRSLRASFTKLDPRQMIKNPIMFTVEAVTFAMLLLIVRIAVTGDTPTSPRPSPKPAAGRRPTRCAKPARRPPPNASNPTDSRTSSAVPN